MNEADKKPGNLKNIILLLVVAVCALVIYVKFPRDTRSRVEPEVSTSPPNPVAETTYGTERTPEYWRNLAELPMEEWNIDTGTFVVKFEGRDVWLGPLHLKDEVVRADDWANGTLVSGGPYIRSKHWQLLSDDRKLVIAKDSAYGRPPGDSVEKWLADLERASKDHSWKTATIVGQVEWMRQEEREGETDASRAMRWSPNPK